MRTRAKSALIMAPLLIIIFLGGYFLIAGVFVLSLIAIREYTTAFGTKKPTMWVMIISLCILTISFLLYHFCSGSEGWPLVIIPVWMFISLLLSFLSMFAMEKRDLSQGMATITGIFYINFLAFHIVLVDSVYTAPINIGPFAFSGLNSYVWIIILSMFFIIKHHGHLKKMVVGEGFEPSKA